MRRSVLRNRIRILMLLSLAAGLTSCGGSGGTVTNPVMANSQAGATPYSLGFIEARPADIAQLTTIRHPQSALTLPGAVDLSPSMPAVGNQGQEGSCVAWATAYAMRGYEARRDVWSRISPTTSAPAFNFSPAFVYNQITGGHDSGAAIPTALTLLAQRGAATLADMPYVAGQFAVQPSAAAFADATHYKLSSFGYIAPADLNSIKVQLANGLPVVIGIHVYYNFYMLGPNQVYIATGGAYQGGHAVTIVGYNDTRQAVEIINSWGTSWADAGYGWISYAALRQIAVEAYSAIDDRGLPAPIGKPKK